MQHSVISLSKYLQLGVQRGRVLYIATPLGHESDGAHGEVCLAADYVANHARPAAVGQQLTPGVAKEHLQAVARLEVSSITVRNKNRRAPTSCCTCGPSAERVGMSCAAWDPAAAAPYRCPGSSDRPCLQVSRSTAIQSDGSLLFTCFLHLQQLTAVLPISVMLCRFRRRRIQLSPKLARS